MYRTWVRWGLFFAIFTQQGCGNDASSISSKLDVIIGTDEQVVVLENEAGEVGTYHNLFDAIGRMSGDCTAFHIGNGVVVTAAHCVQATSTTQPQPCQTLSIAWGYRYQHNAYLQSRCLEILDYKLEDAMDFALLRVDPVPPVALPMAHTEPAEGANLTVFGHPHGEPLHWSGMCTAHWNEALGFLEHQCDTKAGNSGSPVFDHVRKEVVGVHKGGEGSWNWATTLSHIPWKAYLNESAQPRDDGVLRHEGSESFGPFENNEKRLLAAFATRKGRSVSFQVSFDTEEGYDVLRIMDGTGRLQSFSGKGVMDMRDMPTPVTAVLETDYANPSHNVTFDAVKFSP